MTRRVILVGCGKAKSSSAAPARNLYTGGLFRAAREYAEREVDDGWALDWGVLSALHGVLWPDAVVEPYDATWPAPWDWRDKVRWTLELVDHGGPLDEVVVLAGGRYVAEVRKAIGDLVAVADPLDGLQLGERLAWFKRQREAWEVRERAVDAVMVQAHAAWGGGE